MSTAFIREMIRSFDRKKESHLYKMDRQKLGDRISKDGVVRQLNWTQYNMLNPVEGAAELMEAQLVPLITGTSTINVSVENYLQGLCESLTINIKQTEHIVELLKAFQMYNFELRDITKIISENVYPPMKNITNGDDISNDEVHNFCEHEGYDGKYVANYWVKVILSNPQYFNIKKIFEDC